MQLIYPIVLAGGKGSRLDKNKKKQFVELNNIPIFIFSIKTFLSIRNIYSLILVHTTEDIDTYKFYLNQHNLLEKVILAEGGEIRPLSVFNGLKSLQHYISKNNIPIEEVKVLIHDSARPLVSKNDILKVIEALKSYRAVTLAYKITDTLKEIDENNNILKNINRDKVAGITTPQGFYLKDIIDCYENLVKNHSYTNNTFQIFDNITDDTEIMTRFGHQVKIILGEKSNIKITTAEDIYLARSILESQNSA